MLPMYRKIVCALDGSDGSKRALDVALHLARADKQKLWTIFIEEMPRYPGAPSETNEELERADAIFQKLRDEALDAGKKYGVEVAAEKRVGHPAQALVHYVKDAGVDLLVMGHTGHSKFWGTFLGTTADKVVSHATCSVLVVR
jgi:nucleotide-binding universal stress UspA family protein